MTAMAPESVSDGLDDEFDLDIRIDDLGLVDPDRIHQAQSATIACSCSACCPTVYGCTSPGCDITGVYCPSAVGCTGVACN